MSHLERRVGHIDLSSFSMAVMKHGDQGHLEQRTFNLGFTAAEHESPWPLWWDAWQQESRHGSGAIVESLHLDPQAGDRES